MSEASFVLNFNVADFSSASQDFPKSNIVDLGGSKWYLGIEIMQSANRDNQRSLNIFLTCERGTCNENYTATLALMLRGSLVELLFTRTYYFEPLDLEMACFQIDFNCISDMDNGFISEYGDCDIVAEISVKLEEELADVEEDFSFPNSFRSYNSSSQRELNGVVNLQGGHRVRVNKELFSWHSEYFKNIFNNKLFMESSQDSIDLIDFTYKQFRLLYKHIYVESVHLPGRYLHTDGAIRFRLISREGVRQSQKLWNLTEIQKYCQLHAGLLEQTNDASGKMLLKTNSCMGDDVRQLKAVLEIIRCISTEYVWKDGFQTVSAENVEYLLSVGSYFQIPKIIDSCVEFLSRDSGSPDFNLQNRMKLMNKYNLTLARASSVDDRPPIIPRDEIFTEILVNVNFLDTGREEMCSVKYEKLMKIKTLFSDALAVLYSTGVCDYPSKYQLERVRISDPETPFAIDCQCVDVKDNVTFTLGCVYSSKIYSFEVRQKPDLYTHSDHFTSMVPSTQSNGCSTVNRMRTEIFAQKSDFYSGSEQFTSKMPSTQSNACPTVKRKRTEVSAQLTFLDNGEEKTCMVPCDAGMTVQDLFFRACRLSDNVFPSLYEIVTVHARYADSTSDGKPHSFDIPVFVRSTVHSSYAYSFRVKLNTDIPSTSKECNQHPWKLIKLDDV